MTQSYEDLLDRANEARVATEDKQAIELYREALATGGPRDTEARWMLGVSLTNAEQYDEALKELDTVLKTCDDSDKPNALRDHARVLGKLGKYTEAEQDIAQSLELLEAAGNDAEYAATLGFGARLKTEQGDMPGALGGFKKADELLKAADNRYYELYNKLYYAEALVKSGDMGLADTVLSEAEALIPQYGGDKHTKRAQELREQLDV